MSKKTDQFLARIAKRAYRRAPEKVRRSVKNVISQALPASSATQKVGLTPTKSSRQQSKIHMAPEDIGATYDENIVLPMLALENNALHNLLRERQNNLEITRQRLAEMNGASPSPETTKRREEASRLAERYLAGQQHRAATRHLVLANEYPRQGREYGNGFIHQRVKKYLEAGVAVDVVCAGY